MNLPVYLTEACRWLILIVLFFAASGKTFNFSLFRHNLVESFNVPQKWSGFLSFGLITLEWGLMLVIANNGSFLYQAVFLTMCLLSVFTLVIGHLLIKEQLVRCNCFGQSDDKISYYDVIQNLLIILVCIYFLFNTNPINLEFDFQLLAAVNSLVVFVMITNLNHIALIMRDPKEV